MRLHGSRGRVVLTLGAEPAATLTASAWTLDIARERRELPNYGGANRIYVAGLPDFTGTISGPFDPSDRRLARQAFRPVPARITLYADRDAAPVVEDLEVIFDFLLETSATGAARYRAEFYPGRVTVPIRVTLTGPSDGARVVTPVLSWTPAWLGGGPPPAMTSRVFLGTTDPPPLVATTTDTHHTVPAVDPDTTYTWRIEVQSARGDVTSETRTFTTIDESEEDPVILTSDLTVHEVTAVDGEMHTLYSYAVPGGTLGTSRALRVTITGDHLNNTGTDQAMYVDLSFGGSSIAAVAPLTVPSSASRRAMLVEAVISSAGTTGTQTARGRASVGAAGGGVYGPSLADATQSVQLTKNSTVDQTLLLQASHGGPGAPLSTRTLAIWVELL